MKQEMEWRLQPGWDGRDPRQVREGGGTTAHRSLRKLQGRNSPELTWKTRPGLAAPGSLPDSVSPSVTWAAFPSGSSPVMAVGPMS